MEGNGQEVMMPLLLVAVGGQKRTDHSWGNESVLFFRLRGGRYRFSAKPSFKCLDSFKCELLREQDGKASLWP